MIRDPLAAVLAHVPDLAQGVTADSAANCSDCSSGQFDPVFTDAGARPAPAISPWLTGVEEWQLGVAVGRALTERENER